MSMRVATPFLLAIVVRTASTQTIEETCSIEGRITHAGMNLALRKASVGLYPSGGSVAIAETGTGPDGNFCFVNVKPGEYRLAAEQAGYMRREYGAGRWQERGTIFLLSANQRQTANIELFPRGGVRGRVVDYDGDIVPTSRVTALRVIWRNGRREFTQVTDADCDESGEYKLANLPPGKYLVRAIARVQPPPPKIPGRPVDNSEAYGPTFYPGVIDTASASIVEVAPGTVADGTNINLRRGRLFRVRGRVRRLDGTPVAGATVMLGEMSVGTISFRQELVQTTRSPEGTFEFQGVWGGQYFLQARDVSGSDLDGNVVIDASRDVDFVTVTLGEAVRLEGLVIASGQDLPNLNRFRVELDPVDGFFLGSPSGQVEESGFFRIPRMKPGRFAVTIRNLPSTAYIRTVRYGSQELDPPVLDLRHGVSGRVEIVLSNRAASLSGTTQTLDGKPVAGAAVCLIPENQRSTAYRTATSQADGTFRINGIIPGRYQAVAVDDLEPGAEQEPELLTRVGSRASRLEIAEGSSEAIRLVVVSH